MKEKLHDIIDKYTGDNTLLNIDLKNMMYVMEHNNYDNYLKTEIYKGFKKDTLFLPEKEYNLVNDYYYDLVK